jgi:hypothetical protein
MISIGVIGRNLNHLNFKSIFDILDQGVEANFWTYNRYSLDNGKTYNGSDDKYLIFLATTPKAENDKDFVKFSGKPSEEEIAEVMQDFVYRICNENDNTENTDDSNPITITDSVVDIQEVEEEKLNDDVVSNYAPDLSDTNDVDEEYMISAIEEGLVEKPTETWWEPSLVETKNLNGIIVEFNNKTAYLGLEDAARLNELLVHMNTNGLKIVDIVCG